MTFHRVCCVDGAAVTLRQEFIALLDYCWQDRFASRKVRWGSPLRSMAWSLHLGRFRVSSCPRLLASPSAFCAVELPAAGL